jgi:TRAP-type C4-dicarboxylate transport system substrate-binding protein
MRDGRVWAGLGAVAVLLLGGCGGAVDKAGGDSGRRPTTLTMFSGMDEVDTFLDEVGTVSGGALSIKRIHSKHGESGEAEVIRAVRAGRYDLAAVPARAWHGVGVSDFDALIAPLAVDSYALQQKVLESDVAAHMLDGVRAVGVEGVGVLPGPMRKPVGITRSLRTPEDYRGARFGAAVSAVAEGTLRTLGARPVPEAFYGAPIDGTDGVEQQVLNVQADRYDSTATSITANVNLWPRPAVIVANRARWHELSAAQRRDLRRAAHDAIAPTTAAMRSAETEEGVQGLCLRGRVRFDNATSAEIARLRKAVQPVYAWLRRDTRTHGYLDRIADLRAGTETARSSESPSCAGISAGHPADARSALDGAYEMTTTERELAAAGADRTELEPGNWGSFRLVFDKGRFAFTTENKEACLWTYGKLSVQSRQVVWTVTDGGSTNPHGGTNRPGERFVFRWSTYRDLLTLTGVVGEVSPTPFRVKPWRRISDTPSAALLSRRCPPPAAALKG